jgi:hypothetical protein
MKGEFPVGVGFCFSLEERNRLISIAFGNTVALHPKNTQKRNNYNHLKIYK